LFARLWTTNPEVEIRNREALLEQGFESASAKEHLALVPFWKKISQNPLRERTNRQGLKARAVVSTVHWPNENKISDGHRERAIIEAKG